TVLIGPYNDSAVVSGGLWPPDQNLGGAPELDVGPHGGGVFRSYLRFLLAGLPFGIQIDRARLVLAPMDGGTRPVALAADVVQEDWNEGSITWNQQPLTTWRTGVGTWQPSQTTPVTIDLTNAARTWYACGGASNEGVALSADISSGWVAFGSRKSASPPQLEVTFESTDSPLDCVAAQTPAGVSLAQPAAPAPASSGAQIGSINPVTLPTVPVTPTTTPCDPICFITGPAATSAPPQFVLTPAPQSQPVATAAPANNNGAASSTPQTIIVRVTVVIETPQPAPVRATGTP
ncbi:MAG: DNRLRE domain-containing protein, partial [Dehalococcoidia bacterium]